MNNAQRKLAELAGKSIVQHVLDGGWLGASWPGYVPGCSELSSDELDAAWDWMEENHPEILSMSQDNFRIAAELD
jgi:hypothetical protein